MKIRYYRFDRSNYSVNELVTLCFGPRKLLLPFYIVRLLYWKTIGRTVPGEDPIADIRLIADLNPAEAEDVRRRYGFLARTESDLVHFGFRTPTYFRTADSRFAYESYSFYSVENSGAIAAVCTGMSTGGLNTCWIEFYSTLTDGRTLRTNSHFLAGALRPTPVAMIDSRPGASVEQLFNEHKRNLAKLCTQGAAPVEGQSVDAIVRTDLDYYQCQISHWISTGLLVPEHE